MCRYTGMILYVSPPRRRVDMRATHFGTRSLKVTVDELRLRFVVAENDAANKRHCHFVLRRSILAHEVPIKLFIRM